MEAYKKRVFKTSMYGTLNNHAHVTNAELFEDKLGEQVGGTYVSESPSV